MTRAVTAAEVADLVAQFAPHVRIESMTFDSGPDDTATRARVTVLRPLDGERRTETLVLLFGRWVAWQDAEPAPVRVRPGDRVRFAPSAAPVGRGSAPVGEVLSVYPMHDGPRAVVSWGEGCQTEEPLTNLEPAAVQS